MKKFFLVSVSILLTLLALFGVWFGVSYAKNGLAKDLYDKMFNVEEPTEESEEHENYAYKIVVTKPEELAVPTTGIMRNLKVGDTLGGKWYAVDKQRFNLEMTAGDLSFTNGYGGETYAYINDYFGIEVFNIENGFLFYLPETFEGSFYVGYDVVNEVEINEIFNISWDVETLIDVVSEGVYVVEEDDGELNFSIIETICFDEIIYTGNSGEKIEIPVYLESNGKKVPYTGALDIRVIPDARMNVYKDGKLFASGAVISDDEGLYMIKVELVDSKLVVNATCVKTSVNDVFTFELLDNYIDFYIEVATKNNPENNEYVTYRCIIVE